MEILYIWIKEYGCIKEQGFNFSPEYRFKGMMKKNEKNKGKDGLNLCIEKNSNFIEDFFNVNGCRKLTCNISGITAIIGENGAGKTTLLNFIKNNLVDGAGGITSSAVVIISDGTKKIIYHHETLEVDIQGVSDEFKIKSFSKKTGMDHLEEARGTSFVFYSNIFDYVHGETEWGENHNISVNYLIQKDKREGLEMGYISSKPSEINIFRHNEIKRQLDFLNYYYKSKEYLKFTLPKEVRILINSDMVVRAVSKGGIQSIRGDDYNIPKDEEKTYNEYYPLMKHVNTQLKGTEIKHGQPKYRSDFYRAAFNTFFLDLFNDSSTPTLIDFDGFIIKYKIQIEKPQSGEDNDFKAFFADEEFKDMDIYQKVVVFFKLMIEYISSDRGKNDYYAVADDKVITWIVSIVQAMEFIDKCIEHGKYNAFYNIVILNTDESELSIFEFMSIYDKSFLLRPYLLFDWNNISSGQKAQLSMYARFFMLTDKQQKFDNMRLKNNIMILIDEGELFYHPQWQKDFIKTLIEFLREIYSEKNKKRNIQIILTSNSPFIVSDLPSNNVILLKREGKYCKVLDGLQENIYTFGANIHTLLSDSFFVSGGLIGSFAKLKIDSIISLLINGKREYIHEKKGELEAVIGMIGEPVIRNKLHSMLKERLYDEILEDNIYRKLSDRVEQLERALKELTE